MQCIQHDNIENNITIWSNKNKNIWIILLILNSNYNNKI